MAEELMKELENHTAFTIPVFGGIPIADSCVVTWIIMAALVLLSIILTRKLKRVPTGSQCLLEGVIGWTTSSRESSEKREGNTFLFSRPSSFT